MDNAKEELSLFWETVTQNRFPAQAAGRHDGIAVIENLGH